MIHEKNSQNSRDKKCFRQNGSAYYKKLLLRGCLGTIDGFEILKDTSLEIVIVHLPLQIVIIKKA